MEVETAVKGVVVLVARLMSPLQAVEGLCELADFHWILGVNL